jgi:hypothetical protein
MPRGACLGGELPGGVAFAFPPAGTGGGQEEWFWGARNCQTRFRRGKLSGEK